MKPFILFYFIEKKKSKISEMHSKEQECTDKITEKVNSIQILQKDIVEFIRESCRDSYEQSNEIT